MNCSSLAEGAGQVSDDPLSLLYRFVAFGKDAPHRLPPHLPADEELAVGSVADLGDVRLGPIEPDDNALVSGVSNFDFHAC